MRLARKANLIVVATAAVSMLLLYFSSRIILFTRFNAAEHDEAKRAVRRAQAIVKDIAERIDMNVRDYSNWDSMYQHMLEPDEQFTRENLDPSTLSNLSLSARLLYASDGTLVNSEGEPPEGYQPGDPSPAPYPLVDAFVASGAYSVLMKGIPVKGMVPLGQDLYFIVGRPVLPNSGEGESRGAIVFIRRFSEDDVHTIRTLADVEPSLAPAPDRSASAEPTIVETNDESLTTSVCFPDLAGNGLELQIVTPRSILAQGRASLTHLAIALALGGLMLVTAVSLMLEHTVIRRVLRLMHDLAAIRDHSSVNGRVGTHGSDEITVLAEAINATLTALEKSRAAVVESEARFRTMAQCAPLGIFVAAADGRCSYSNAAADEITSSQHTGLAESHLASVLAPECYAEFLVAWRAAMDSSSRMSGTYRLKCGDQWVSINAAAVGADAPSNSAIGTIENITERILSERTLNEARAAAEAANIAKSQFLANMSHEIRTPMTAILGFTDLLCDPSMADSARLDHVSTIRRNAQHLLSIINDLLDISKIEAGRMEVESIDCAPTEIIASVASLMRAAASAKGVLLKVEYAGPMPASIRSDPTRLRQILLNLVGNAVKFTQHGSILIRASTQFTPGSPSGEMQVDITDTGIGMNEAAIAKLFMPFSQADESMARRFGGTGLGLTISKKLSQMLGGDIEVTSTPGTGSTFSLRVLTGSLAAARWIERPTEAIIQTPTAASPSPLHLKARVLLAEDGPDNQRLICFHLKRAGIEVTAVTDGQQAVDATLRAQEQASPFSVILMDMQMPILDGYSATRKLRSLGYTGPIVALTAHAMAEDRQKCLDAGCDDYAAKPIDAANLIATCERWCTQARSDASRAKAA